MISSYCFQESSSRRMTDEDYEELFDRVLLQINEENPITSESAVCVSLP